MLGDQLFPEIDLLTVSLAEGEGETVVGPDAWVLFMQQDRIAVLRRAESAAFPGLINPWHELSVWPCDVGWNGRGTNVELVLAE